MADTKRVVLTARQPRRERSGRWYAQVYSGAQATAGDPLEVETSTGLKAAVVIGFIGPHGVYTRLVDPGAARRLIIAHDVSQPMASLRNALLELPEVSSEQATLRLRLDSCFEVRASMLGTYDPQRVQITMTGGKTISILGLSSQAAGIEPQRASARAHVCSTCMGARVLRHADPAHAEEPCPDCPPEVNPGPLEWSVVERSATQYDNSFTVVVQKATARASFMIYPTTLSTMVFDATSRQITRAGVNREYAPDMAIARLLCGLRDGGIKP